MRLRPSLRAAVRLHATHGLPDLAEKIGTGHLGAAADIIFEGTDADTAKHLVDALRYEGVRVLDGWREPLTNFLFALLSIDPSSTKGRKPDAASSQHDENAAIEKHLETLFEIGTGWLGWSPADTWAATPSEILVAHRGLVAKLKAVNGVENKSDHDPREEVSQDEVKAGLAKLKRLSGAKKRKAA
ncbi:hypothetical protein [Mesorhizobium marinum]|uniref:hypothetical protein n=1 Tax=Mesorhizobium marinum TaxID=3228790 RepID=UPI0034670E0E